MRPGAPDWSGWLALLVNFQTRVALISPNAAPTGSTTRQPRPKSESAQKPRPVCPMSRSEPITMQTMPAAMNQPCPPAYISATSSPTPRTHSARAPALTGSIWKATPATRMQIAPTTPGTMVPG